jgi:hypothetical protein
VKGQSGTGFIVTSYSATDEYKCSNDGRTKQSINGGNGSWKHDILIISAEGYTPGEGQDETGSDIYGCDGIDNFCM